jgi:glutamate synthase (NADPH/NADH) large chain
VLDVEEKRSSKWRLQPGKMLLIDMEEGRIISDEEIKRELATKPIPIASGWSAPSSSSKDLPVEAARAADVSLLDRQQAFGYTQEDTKIPDGADGDHRPGSHRLDGHRHADLGAVGQVEAALHLFQAELRAGHQPADRPDPRGTGDEPGVVHRPAPEPARPEGPVAKLKRLEVRQPILTNEDLEKIRSIGDIRGPFDTKTLDITYPADEGAAGMAPR